MSERIKQISDCGDGSIAILDDAGMLWGASELTAYIAGLEAERNGWRRVAVLHGAEVQQDHEYMSSHYQPLQQENIRLVQMVGELSDKLRGLEALAKDARDDWAFTLAGENPIYPTPANRKDAQAWLARYEALTP